MVGDDMATPQCWLSLNGKVGCAGGDTKMKDKTISSEETERKQARPDRKDRLAEQLRANLQRRKAQSRSRRTGEADQRPEGLAAATKLPED
jgi:hypothetical protein